MPPRTTAAGTAQSCRRLEITPAGRKLLADVLDDWREVQRKARELLSPAVADAIAGAVDTLWAAADEPD